jgi:hypothetical protein
MSAANPAGAHAVVAIDIPRPVAIFPNRRGVAQLG